MEWSEPWWALGEGGIQLAWPESSSLPSSSSPSRRRNSFHYNIGDSLENKCNKTNENKIRTYSDDFEDEIQCLETNGFENGGEHSKVHKMVDDHLRHWYRGISNFSEVDNQPNLLLCWVAGESAKIADQLDDDEVRKISKYHI